MCDIKRRNPDELVRDILAYAERYKFTKFVIETNGFQKLVLKDLEDEANKEGVYLPIEEVTNTSDKVDRIYSMYRAIKNKTLQFDRNCDKLNYG